MTGLKNRLGALKSDTSGVAYVEFALSLPILIGLSMYGIELTNYVLCVQRLSQIAAVTADTASRGVDTMDESQVNELMLGAKRIGSSMKFADRGRIILSDLEPNSDASRQYVRWQRCAGTLNVTSRYGVPKNSAGTTLANGTEMTAPVDIVKSVPRNGTADTPTTGMGPVGNQVMATSGLAVMFVEVQYDYQPIVPANLMGSTPRLSATAAFNVRQRTNYAINTGGVATADRSLCNKFTS